jgi:hypothetical protein
MRDSRRTRTARTQGIGRARGDVRPLEGEAGHVEAIGAVDVLVRVVKRLPRGAEQAGRMVSGLSSL